jgi:MFS family permease
MGKQYREMPAAVVVALVATLAASYGVSQLLRNSVGVIAPDLAAEMAVSASELGVLSSAFFFAFAAAQLPLGVAIDRYGPKTCMILCAGVVVGAAFLFATATSPFGLVVSRVLMGLGTSCYLMGPLTIYARRFPPERFAMLAGLQLSLGTIGTLLATAPLAFAAATIGWRASFSAIAVAMAVVGALIAITVKEGEAPHEAPRETLRASVIGIGEALRTDSVGRLFVMHMATYSSFVLIIGLWGGPYLSHVYGYGLTERGTLLLIPAVTQIIGLMVYGSADRLFGSYKAPVLIGGVVTAAFLAGLAAAGMLPRLGLIAWLAGFGFCAAFTPVVIAHGKSLFPPRLVGRGMTLLNMGTMGGAFVAQLVTGFVIDMFPQVAGAYPLAAYRLVFGLQAACLVTAMLAYLASRDPRRGSERV